MRTIYHFNEGWRFGKPGEEAFPVTLPHTWNAVDGQDGGNDYFRGTCCYEKNFKRPGVKEEEQVYLEFQGVFSSAEVYLDDTLLAVHAGGYSTFRVNLTGHLEEENRLKVLVDNAANRRVYPQKADFTFYGGIYRDVNLIIVPEAHFDLDYYGGTGVKVETEIMESGKDALVCLTAFVTGEAERVRFMLSNGMSAETEVCTFGSEGNGSAYPFRKCTD